MSRDVRDWVVVGDHGLLVRAQGERYFDIALRDRCPALHKRTHVRFTEGVAGFSGGTHSGQQGAGGDPVTSDGRICADLGDAVVPSGGALTGSETPCRLESIRRIDKRAFDAASAAAAARGPKRRHAGG